MVRSLPGALGPRAGFSGFQVRPSVPKYTIRTRSDETEQAKQMSEAMPDQAAAASAGIVVTESAARRIAALKEQEEAADAFLRIAVSGGGCSGFQYGLNFDDSRTLTIMCSSATGSRSSSTTCRSIC